MSRLGSYGFYLNNVLSYDMYDMYSDQYYRSFKLDKLELHPELHAMSSLHIHFRVCVRAPFVSCVHAVPHCANALSLQRASVIVLD